MNFFAHIGFGVRGISWEAHLFGAVAGVMIALFEDEPTMIRKSIIGGSDGSTGSLVTSGSPSPSPLGAHNSLDD
jgi:hypothetical protein